MGFFKSNEEKGAELRQEMNRALAAASPSGEPLYAEWLPSGHTDMVDRTLRGRLSLIDGIAYCSQVGIRPEDIYAFCPTTSDTTARVLEMGIIYRDRPEYAAGRERYWAAD